LWRARTQAKEGGLDARDRPWFEPLVRSLERSAFQFALACVHDALLAEDIVQEAFAKVWASPKTPSHEPEFRRWLYRAIANLARDHHRKQRRWSRLRLWSAPSLDPSTEVERRMQDAELATALRRLSLRERQAIYFRYFEDRPFAETARLIGTGEGNARLIVHRALVKLRGRLKATPVVEGVQA
jgi:RNA polymerase sigma-70 factor (ECF subfamily)